MYGTTLQVSLLSLAAPPSPNSTPPPPRLQLPRRLFLPSRKEPSDSLINILDVHRVGPRSTGKMTPNRRDDVQRCVGDVGDFELAVLGLRARERGQLSTRRKEGKGTERTHRKVEICLAGHD